MQVNELAHSILVDRSDDLHDRRIAAEPDKIPTEAVPPGPLSQTIGEGELTYAESLGAEVGVALYQGDFAKVDEIIARAKQIAAELSVDALTLPIKERRAIHLEHLKLPAKFVSVLAAHFIVTAGDVEQMTMRELLGLRGVSGGLLEQLVTTIGRVGLRLKDDLDESEIAETIRTKHRGPRKADYATQ